MDLYDDVFRYDLVHGKFADPVTFSFFRDQIKSVGEPVLDLACGTGNLLIPLANGGVEVTGLDLSQTMLDECRSKAAESGLSVDLVQGDMRSFDLGRRFKMILIAGCSFQHLETDEDIAKCMECVARHLDSDGKIIIELFNPIESLLLRDMDQHLMIGEFGTNVLSEVLNYDTESRVSQITWNFWDRESDTTQKLTFRTREIFPNELNPILGGNGFGIDMIFGDFDGTAFSARSPKQIVIASPLQAE